MPATGSREDVLRLLRFFRFYAHFGAPPPDGEALAAARDAGAAAAHAVGRAYRGRDPETAGGCRPRRRHAPDAAAPRADKFSARGRTSRPPGPAGGDRGAYWALEGGPARRLAAVLESGGGDGCTPVAGRWHLSNALRDRLVEALWTPPAPRRHSTTGHVARCATSSHAGGFPRSDAFSLGPAINPQPRRCILRALSSPWPIGTTPLSAARAGCDRPRHHVRPGPRRDLLRDLERWWVAGDFTRRPQGRLAELTQRVGGSNS